MRNILLEKLYVKYGGETGPRPFSKIKNLSISLVNRLKFIQFVLIVCPSRRLPNDVNIKVVTTCFYFI